MNDNNVQAHAAKFRMASKRNKHNNRLPRMRGVCSIRHPRYCFFSGSEIADSRACSHITCAFVFFLSPPENLLAFYTADDPLGFFFHFTFRRLPLS